MFNITTKGERQSQYAILPRQYIHELQLNHIYFINEPETIAKGLIEIIYNLQKITLFHGEINPSPGCPEDIQNDIFLI